MRASRGIAERHLQEMIRMSQQALKEMMEVKDGLRHGKVQAERLNKALLLGIAAAEIGIGSGIDAMQVLMEAERKGPRKGHAPVLSLIKGGKPA